MAEEQNRETGNTERGNPSQPVGDSPPVDNPSTGGEPTEPTQPRPDPAGDGQEPQERVSGQETSSSDGPTMHTEIGDLDAETANIIGQLNINNIIGSAIKPLSREHAIPISFDSFDEDTEVYVHDKEQTNRFLTILHERRLMVLTGEPEIGKKTTALYLSQHLREMDTEIDELNLIHTLDKNVRVDLPRVIGNTRDFGKRILIFKDAFTQRNREILEFFVNLDGHQLESMSVKLRENHMFLIFTADSPTIARCQTQLSRLGIEGKLELSDDLLIEGFSRKLAQFADSRGQKLDEIQQSLGDRTEYVVKTLKTMPAVMDFVDNHLKEVIDENLDLEDALERVNDLTHWFCQDVAADFETWCFTFALGLSHCLPDSGDGSGVSWFEFEELRREIAKFFKRELRHQLTQQMPTDAQKEKAHGIPVEVISERSCLNRSRAQIQMHSNSGGDVVQFINERYPLMLWKVFLKENRKILTAIYPVLRKMAEGSDLYMRAHAARILGRIGEVDPQHVILPLIDRWADSRDYSQRAVVGYLYQGIFASENQSYRDDCLKILRSLAAVDEHAFSGIVQVREEETRRARSLQWTAIATYNQIGVYDLPLAMRDLRQIAERKFTQKIEETQRIHRLLNRVEDFLGGNSNADEVETMALAAYHKVLREMAKRVFSEEGSILFALQHTIISLCLKTDAIQVFDELHQWMRGNRKALAALISLIFLQGGGIAETLENRNIEVPKSQGDDRSEVEMCNPIVVSMAASENSVRQMARFLEGLFYSFSTFQGRLRLYLQRSFFMHLRRWAEDAYPIEWCRVAVEKLFVELLRRPNAALKDELENLLEEDSGSFDDSDCSSFANAVRERLAAVS